jgi:class 3 adenylate cyclase
VSIRFARIGSEHVAYRTFGEGPTDILLFLGEYLPVDSIDEEPRYARALRRLTSLGRVIAFNRRGVGLSDRPDGPLTLEQNVEDAIAVLDHLDVLRAVVFGWNVSGPPAIRFAAQHRDRTSALLLANTWARLTQAADYEIGVPREVVAGTAERTTATDPVAAGEFDFLSMYAPSVARDERFRTWWDQAGHRGASPARSMELWQMLIDMDERPSLPRITARTLVLARSGILFADIARHVAREIRGAVYEEFPGSDLLWWVGDADVLLDAIERFLGAGTSAPRPLRKLASVLFFDVVRSTEHAVRLGDRRWRELLETYVDVARREVDRGGGRLISTSGDGALATFEMPADAVRTGTRIADAVRALGIDIKAGIHTGEIEIIGDDVAGLGVHIAARVMSTAGPGEVLVSRTVCDLVTGSGLAFEDRGEHDLKGVPGSWRLYAVRP